jgi:hypothetical protein
MQQGRPQSAGNDRSMRHIQDTAARCSLNYLVWTFWSMRCSDRRNRVYAFLSLTKSWQAISIEADYTKTFEDIYSDMLRMYLDDGILDELEWTLFGEGHRKWDDMVRAEGQLVL